MTRSVIDPVTRIEGHLRVEMEVENGKVSDAWVSGGCFRGIELVVENRTPEDAAQIGVKDKQIVKLSIKSEERSLIFDDVIARVSPTCATRVHLDTDEANAAGISGEVEGEIIL